ncbi:ABC transporter substrate-binding protein [Bdellovibrio sp. KM01]|uniref:substrate-binding periplasmic protein n=1 Tax=Bdellovibrio sp. KM01 TaxID=2748865 RepID=UPI0015EAB94A|nr:transporter substrate-binding domain-containing protein [Bdellovibrio sp. KM01]QLY26663.1 transporter substrate-binding domain-containing protein [Bdellovibrio sp. KM01]
MKHIFLLFFFFLMHSQTVLAEDKTEIRAAIPEGLAPPLVFANRGKYEGLVVDYVNALAEAMDRKASFSMVTHYRLNSYLLKGKLDILCYTSTVWDDAVGKHDFSKTLFIKREIILGPAPMPKKVSGLEGKTIGTILQYVYPSLDPYFESGKIKRDDNVSEEGNLKKLMSGRIQYVVTDQIFIDYFRMDNPNITKDREELFLRDYPIVCSVSRKGRVKKADLDKAINEIKTSGKLKAIFRKYGSSYID